MVICLEYVTRRYFLSPHYRAATKKKKKQTNGKLNNLRKKSRFPDYSKRDSLIFSLLAV